MREKNIDLTALTRAELCEMFHDEMVKMEMARNNMQVIEIEIKKRNRPSENDTIEITEVKDE